MKNQIIPIILCGGSGSRLWPKSRSQYPKQFINILDGDHSLLQQTAKRLEFFGEPILVCNDKHRFIAADQMQQLDISPLALILEPESKNTAAAVALAALQALQFNEDAILVVSPADHYIADDYLYREALNRAVDVAREGRIALLGIQPTHPETGYGYIIAHDQSDDVSKVKTFIEKPDRATAERLISGGAVYWNCGVFVFEAKTILKELDKHSPEVLEACEKSLKQSHADLDFIRIDRESFVQAPETPIDIAVMEKTDLASVVPLDVGWNDVGSWHSVWNLSAKDEQGNVSSGDAFFVDSQNCLTHTESRLVSVLGLHDVVVIETKDAVLVADKNRSQDIKGLVSKLKSQMPSVIEQHREVFRPWGKYDSIDQNKRYQVKRITVNPGQKLSIQMHHHRAEHWIVVSGTARVGVNEETRLLTENESVYIPLGAIHYLENPGKIPLELIEVQSGSYLSEDDIVRFEDIYGRV